MHITCVKYFCFPQPNLFKPLKTLGAREQYVHEAGEEAGAGRLRSHDSVGFKAALWLPKQHPQAITLPSETTLLL